MENGRPSPSPGTLDVGQETTGIRERPKSRGAGREFEGFIVPTRPVKAEGRERHLR